MPVGEGLGVHGGKWGSAPYLKHPLLPLAQVVAGLLMFAPLLTAFWTPWNHNCWGVCTSYVQLSIGGTVPFSILNHFGHAAAGRWVPVLQKLDRSFIALSSIAGSYALSQDVAFTMGSVLLAATAIWMMWFASPKYRDSESLGTGLVVVSICYGLLPMILHRATLDPNLLPAAGSILAGFTLFQLDPLGVWTDSAWHLLLAMGLEPPALVVASLAKTAGTLTPEEFIAALRPLTGKSITASGGRGLLTAAATRAMGQLKSSRQAWQLDGLCKALRLDVGEVIPDDEIFEEDSRAQQFNHSEGRIEHLADVILTLVHDAKLRAEAHDVESDISANNPQKLKEDAKEIMDLLQAMSSRMGPAEAAHLGAEITIDDISRILNVTNLQGHFETVEDECKDCFQGDMKPENEQQLLDFIDAAMKAQLGGPMGLKAARRLSAKKRRFGAGKPWKGADMKYCIHPQAEKHQGYKEAVDKAMKAITKAVPCIKFTDVGYDWADYTQNYDGKCAQSPAVLFTRWTGGCNSYVGMLTHKKSQGLNLANGCLTMGIVIHEILHALGMAHEQSRPDRDAYVYVYESRIKAGQKHNFDVGEEGDMARPYDLLSIMHYSADAFSTNGKPTIVARDKAFASYSGTEREKIKMGNRVGMTQLDADQLADLYTAERGYCVSALLTDTKCTDMIVDGKPWADKWGSGCDAYKKNGDCSKWVSATYCCGCGEGGAQEQVWSHDCDLCPGTSIKPATCTCGQSSSGTGTVCKNEEFKAGTFNPRPFCRCEEGHLEWCAIYTGFTTDGCRCKRKPKGWTFEGGQVAGTCGDPNSDGYDWCYTTGECEHTWGKCELAD
ncbi:unnamed protein product [Durusdinium trenchii]|uniref:Metalloendopeptidase n=1 Tax=Durusdinium trenchii TaxID=1381693 RepID=A0ABP0QEU4_9DINO